MSRGYKPPHLKTAVDMANYNAVSEIHLATPKGVQQFEFIVKISEQIKENELFNHEEKTYTLENISLTEVLSNLQSIFEESYLGKPYTGRELYVIQDNIAIEFKPKVRNEYIEVTTEYFYADKEELIDSENKFKERFSSNLLEGRFAKIDWIYGHKAFTTTIKELIADEFIGEAYPIISDLAEWADDYLHSHESVLIMLGRAGTGKTRLIRYIIQRYIENNKEEPKVLYGANQHTLQNEKVFTTFLNGSYNFLILEDVDQSLLPRKDGNFSMTNLLTTADGLIQNLNRKIIITTNLPNIRDIDEALLRSGRCWGRYKFRNHNREEAQQFLDAIGSKAKLPEKESFVLSDLYKLAKGE